MSLVTLHELIDAGMHYGHHASRWNPKMRPYIFGKRNFIHIIDLRETLRGLITACRFVTAVVAAGRTVVFVGTKRQARRTVREQALRCGMPFVADRWLGGTLTNFRTIRARLDRLFELEAIVEGPELEHYTKKEGARLKRELAKIHRNLDGIRHMDELPGALVLIDPRREKIAVSEASALNIPTVGLADTDCDPDKVDVLIPGNDDAMRAVEVTLHCLGDAVLAGKEKRRDLVRAETATAVSAAAQPAAASKAAVSAATPEEKTAKGREQ